MNWSAYKPAKTAVHPAKNVFLILSAVVGVNALWLIVLTTAHVISATTATFATCSRSVISIVSQFSVVALRRARPVYVVIVHVFLDLQVTALFPTTPHLVNN